MTTVDKISFLYTNIGRGHPFYLDGIIEALVRRGGIGLVRSERDVFDVSGGFSLIAWQLARWLYQKGSSGGVVGRIYGRIRTRNDYSNPGLIPRVLGRDICRLYMKESEPLLVAHPLLVGLLRGRQNLIYQHGEVCVPGESLVKGASIVLVPTEEAAAAFLAAGYGSDNVIVTGLCIELPMVKQAADCFRMRVDRLNEGEPLTGAFLSSGAEPKSHIQALVTGAISVVRAQGKVILFARHDGRFARTAVALFERNGINLPVVSPVDPMTYERPPVLMFTYSGRREETSVTTRSMAQFDYLVAPSHERTNWALGLGLPMFAVTPTIGPFAPLNLQILLERGVAEEIDADNAGELGHRVNNLRKTGALTAMAEAGWNKYEINGFAHIADFLQNTYGV